jgi:hypothetical protein
LANSSLKTTGRSPEMRIKTDRKKGGKDQDWCEPFEQVVE